MGIFNGFICDRCKREFRACNKDYNPVTIQLKISFGSTYPIDYTNTIDYKVWCRECLISSGFHKPTTKEDVRVSPNLELTFEEKFSIMIEELGFVKEL